MQIVWKMPCLLAAAMVLNCSVTICGTGVFFAGVVSGSTADSHYGRGRNSVRLGFCSLEFVDYFFGDNVDIAA